MEENKNIVKQEQEPEVLENKEQEIKEEELEEVAGGNHEFELRAADGGKITPNYTDDVVHNVYS